MALGTHLATVLSEQNLVRCRVALGNAFAKVNSPPGNTRQRKAAVLIPLCLYQSVPSVLFVRRPLWMRKHAGEISFPGGVIEPEDLTLAGAALRECNEELGISLSHYSIIGSLPFWIPNRDGSFLVSAVLAHIGNVIQPTDHLLPENSASNHILRPHLGEVADVYIVPITKLVQNERFVTFRSFPRGHWKGPCYPVKTSDFPQLSIQIWGLTGFMLHQALRILLPTLERA